MCGGVGSECGVSTENMGCRQIMWGCRQRMPGGVGIEYRGVGRMRKRMRKRECVGVGRECVVVSAANVGCRQRIWGVGRECGVSAEDVGCRQRMLGVGRGCGVSAEDVGCRQRMWGVGRGCGVSAEDVGCRQRMWGVGRGCGVSAENACWGKAEPTLGPPSRSHRKN